MEVEEHAGFDVFYFYLKVFKNLLSYWPFETTINQPKTDAFEIDLVTFV